MVLMSSSTYKSETYPSGTIGVLKFVESCRKI